MNELNKTKLWYQSRSFWINIIGAVILLVDHFSKSNVIDPNIAGLVLAVANMIERMLRQPVEIERKLL